MKTAANETYKLPPALFHARSKALWFAIGVVALVGASFATLDLQWAQFLSADALRRMGRVRLQKWLKANGCVNTAKVASLALDAAESQRTTTPTQKLERKSSCERREALICLQKIAKAIARSNRQEIITEADQLASDKA